MKLTYDQETDAFYARFAPDGTPIVETREVAPNVNIDLDERGDLVGFEVLHVRLRGQRLADREDAANEARLDAEALADHHAGRTVSHEKVARWLDSWGTGNESPCPKPGPR